VTVPHAIHIFHRAMADIRAATLWRSRRSPSNAARWHAGVLNAIRALANNPDRCPLADEAADLGVDLRQLLYGRRPHVYRILFTIDGQTVNVLRDRHAAQDRLAPDDL
jgi:plasmid stabilization system protein ParE